MAAQRTIPDGVWATVNKWADALGMETVATIGLSQIPLVDVKALEADCTCFVRSCDDLYGIVDLAV